MTWLDRRKQWIIYCADCYNEKYSDIAKRKFNKPLVILNNYEKPCIKCNTQVWVDSGFAVLE